MNHDDASEGAAQFSDGGAWGAPAPSFSREERPIVQRVFKKFCNLRDTLEEIEGWIDARRESESPILLPGAAAGNRIVLTPENLECFVAVERRAIVESRDARGAKGTWTV